MNSVYIVSAMKISLKLVFILCCVLIVLSTGPGLIGNAGAETGHFPLYASIQPNISFWIKIYSVYPSNKGVIHDKRNLDIIYDVIDLEYPDLPGSRKINRKRIKEIKKVYKNILKKLAHGLPPSLPEEQRSWVNPGLLKLVYTQGISTSQELQTGLAQLLLAEAGVPEAAAPWLWEGLPLAYQAESDPLGHQIAMMPQLIFFVTMA